MPAPNPRSLVLLAALVMVLCRGRDAFAQGSAPADAPPAGVAGSSSSQAPAAPPAATPPAATAQTPATATAQPTPDQPPPGAAVSPYGSWNGSAPYGPPPVISLVTPPPPELEPPAYARRAVELLPELMLGFPQCTDGSLSNARCAGLRGGLGLGLGGLWRVSSYFAFGGTISALGFGFRPPATAQLSDARGVGLFGGVLGRVYFTENGALEPYLELALGGGALGTVAVEAADGKQYQESAAGGALRVGGGLEFFVGPRLRLGPALDITRFGTQHVRRCNDSNQCLDLDPKSYGHGVGFVTLSCRLTILVGPKL